MPGTRQADAGQEIQYYRPHNRSHIGFTGLSTGESPPDWYLPVNIIRSKAMCRLSGIRTEIPERTGRSSRHGISAPERNTALSRVLKVPNRHLQTPPELHALLADIRQIEPCAAMMRTSFHFSTESVILRNTFQPAEANTALGRRRCPTGQPPAPFRLSSPA